MFLDCFKMLNGIITLDDIKDEIQKFDALFVKIMQNLHNFV